MLKYCLTLLVLLIALSAMPAYADDTPPVLLGPSGWNNPEEFRDPNLPNDAPVPVKEHRHHAHHNHRAACGVEGKPACPLPVVQQTVPNPQGVNRITGLPNNNASNTAPGGVNRITGQVNGVTTTPCGVGGKGPCSRQGPGGVNPTNGKVNPY